MVSKCTHDLPGDKIIHFLVMVYFVLHSGYSTDFITLIFDLDYGYSGAVCDRTTSGMHINRKKVPVTAMPASARLPPVNIFHSLSCFFGDKGLPRTKSNKGLTQKKE